MKRVTKLTAFLLALILVFGCCMSAFASGAGETTAEPTTEAAAETAAETTEPEEPAETADQTEPEQAAEEAETTEPTETESAVAYAENTAATYADGASVTIQAGGDSVTLSMRMTMNWVSILTKWKRLPVLPLVLPMMTQTCTWF